MTPLKTLLTILIYLVSLGSIGYSQNSPSSRVQAQVDSLTFKYYGSVNKNPQESLRYARQAFSYMDRLSDSDQQFTIASNYATSLYINGKYNQALTVLDTVKTKVLNKNQEALYFTIRGLAHNDLDNFTQAESDFSRALRIYRDLNDKNNEFAILNNLGLLHNNIGNYKTSLEYYLRCYDIIHDLKIKIDRYKYYLNIGTVNFNLQNFKASLEAFNEALDYARQKSDSLRIFKSHEKIGQAKASLNELEPAISHLTKALSGYKALNLKKETCNTLINLGDLYGDTGRKDKQYQKYNEAFQIAQKKPFTQEKFRATSKLAKYFMTRDSQRSKSLYKKIIEDKTQIVNKEIVRDAYNALYELEKTTHPLKALGYLERFHELEKEIREKLALSQQEQIEARYDLKQKELEIQNLKDSFKVNELELENKNQKIKFLIIFSVLSIVLLILILTSLVQKRRAERALAIKNDKINAQNTQLIRSNKEIRERRKELTDLNKVKSQLLSVIAHDVKSPITDLHNLLAILRTNANTISKNELIKNLAIIESNTTNILNLLNNILNWVISQSAGFKVKVTSFSLNELIRDNLNLIESSRVAKDLNITFREHKHVDLIASDRNIVDFVVRNLLSNAVKFTGEGGNIQINILDKEDHFIRIEVVDSGIGLNTTTHQMLRNNEERVPSAQGTNSEQGYGIGLALGKKMLATIGSKITYKKNEPTGSIFTIHLKTSYRHGTNKSINSR